MLACDLDAHQLSPLPENHPMTNPSFSETQLKDLIKAAILEIFQERRDLFHEIISEALEDMALVKAIDEGKDSESVSRETIFAIYDLFDGGFLVEFGMTPKESGH